MRLPAQISQILRRIKIASQFSRWWALYLAALLIFTFGTALVINNSSQKVRAPQQKEPSDAVSTVPPESNDSGDESDHVQGPRTTQPANPATAPETKLSFPVHFQAGSSNGLITNEFAFYNPADSSAKKSSDWEMTSGSLFAQGGAFWTGQPDTCQGEGPNSTSSNCTNSNVFRAKSKLSFEGSISMSLSIIQLTDIHNSVCNTDDTCWHGTHVWMRYQSQYNLYYASLNRVDGKMVIKRKVPCGNENDGTYFILGSYTNHDFAAGKWNRYKTNIHTNADGSVTITVFDVDSSATRPIIQAVDKGGVNPNWSSQCKTPGKYPSSSYPPLTAAGSVGVRGDYANFKFKDLVVNN